MLVQDDTCVCCRCFRMLHVHCVLRNCMTRGVRRIPHLDSDSQYKSYLCISKVDSGNPESLLLHSRPSTIVKRSHEIHKIGVSSFSKDSQWSWLLEKTHLTIGVFDISSNILSGAP